MGTHGSWFVCRSWGSDSNNGGDPLRSAAGSAASEAAAPPPAAGSGPSGKDAHGEHESEVKMMDKP